MGLALLSKSIAAHGIFLLDFSLLVKDLMLLIQTLYHLSGAKVLLHDLLLSIKDLLERSLVLKKVLAQVEPPCS